MGNLQLIARDLYQSGYSRLAIARRMKVRIKDVDELLDGPVWTPDTSNDTLVGRSFYRREVPNEDV